MRTMKLNENNRTTPFCIRLADTVIRIEPMSDYTRDFTGGSLSDAVTADLGAD